MNKKQRTKAEHKVPDKSHLDHFKDEKTGKLWIYKDKGFLVGKPISEIPKEIPPAAFLKEINFYESPLFNVNEVENTLAKIENEFNNVLRKKIMNKKGISTEEKQIVSNFISSLENRTSASKENINNFLDKVSEHFTALEKQFNQGKISFTHEELLKLKEENSAFTQSVAASIEINRWQFSDFLFLFIKDEYESEEQYFITTDHPVTLYDFTSMNSFYGIQPLSPTVEIVIPLTSKIALFINNVGVNGYKEISPNTISEINNRSLLTSFSYIISPKKMSQRFIDNSIKRFRQSIILEVLYDRLNNEFLERHPIPKKIKK